jgi:hypothetical protein
MILLLRDTLTTTGSKAHLPRRYFFFFSFCRSARPHRPITFFFLTHLLKGQTNMASPTTKQMISTQMQESVRRYAQIKENEIATKLYQARRLRCCNCGLGVYYRFQIKEHDGKIQTDYIRLPLKYNPETREWAYWPGLVACSFNCALGYMYRSVHWQPSKTPYLFHRNLLERYGLKLIVASAPPIECFLYSQLGHKLSSSSSSSSSDTSAKQWATGIPASSAYQIYQIPVFQFALEAATAAIPPHPIELAALINGDGLPDFCVSRYYSLPQLIDLDLSKQVVFDANADTDASVEWTPSVSLSSVPVPPSLSSSSSASGSSSSSSSVPSSLADREKEKEGEYEEEEEEDDEADAEWDEDALLEQITEGIVFGAEEGGEPEEDEKEDDSLDDSDGDGNTATSTPTTTRTTTTTMSSVAKKADG